MPNSISERIRAAALAEGFDAVRIARADAPEGAGTRLGEYLAGGRHGSMDWMSANADRRADPKTLWPEARSVIVLGMNYGPDSDPLDALSHRDKGVISVYARGADYHDVIKKKLKRIASRIATDFSANVKVFVDTAPVMEKPLAQAAGLGWQGKHTNLVSREFGSWLFLGSIFTTLELETDEPGQDHCGECHRCLDICPTKAFPAPYQLDARRCISYLTIEHKGPIAPEFRAAMGNRIYGCDDCLAVCPWNKFASVARENKFHAREALSDLALERLAGLDDAAFRALFSSSPIKRIGRDRFVRNVLIAIGNSGNTSLAASAKNLLNDVSPLVRGMAVWALARLLSEKDFAALAASSTETDETVQAEWAMAGR
jgi:epoxyqueuosine reductase